MGAKLSAVEARARDSDFVARCNFWRLQAQLPLCWPTPPNVPPSPKNRYRSQYIYLGWQDLQDPAAWDELADFDLVLRLVDFSGLRPLLAQRLGWTSAQGWAPFDPVSLFLLHGWQIVNGWNRAETLRNLAHKRNADYAQRFGFVDGIYPSEGGLRHFLTALGRHSDADGDTLPVELDQSRKSEIAIQYLNQLLAGAVHLIREAGLLSPEAWSQALVCPDGMLHDAASRLRCTSVQASCYQPTTTDALRACPAQEKERQGCDCDTVACAEVCKYAPARDAEARFVWYSGSNQRPANPNQSTDPAQKKDKRGRGCYGYRSLPLLLADPVRRFHLSLLTDFLPANDREAVPATALLLQLSAFYPDLDLDVFVGDAGFGTDVVLRTVYRLGARRIVDLRAHETDKNKDLWPIRGYDDKGRLICPFGYAFTANGYDAQRQRYKLIVLRTSGSVVRPAFTVLNRSFAWQEPTTHPKNAPTSKQSCPTDASSTSARPSPMAPCAWSATCLWVQRPGNASTTRPATPQKLAMPPWSVGDSNACPSMAACGAKPSSAVGVADTWSTLTTLARLVREATFAAQTA